MISFPTTVETLMPHLATVTHDKRNSTSSDTQNQTVPQQFDSIILRQMLESILPDCKGGTFGGGTAGGIWRSMMAEQIAGVLSKSNVLGTSSIGKNGSGPQQ